MNISNILTIIRIIIIPIIVLCIYFTNPYFGWIAFILFCLAGITDYFDGYLARLRNEVTNFGTFLDPIADKLLVAAVVLILTSKGVIKDWDTIPALIILLREITVSLNNIIRAGIVSQSFITPLEVKIRITAATNNLSAIGSKNVPKFVTSFLSLAK